MRKLLVVLFLVLLLTLSVTAWAEYTYGLGVNSPKEIPVKAKYVTGDTAAPVYSIDISWGSMAFDYKVNKGAWNPATHTYGNTSAAWTCGADENKITVTNHSNAEVQCDLSYAPVVDDVTGTLSTPRCILASAADYPNNLTAVALTLASELTLSGSLPENMTTLTEIGTITVTLSPYN